MKKIKVSIQKYWGLPSFYFRLGRFNFSILLTHYMRMDAKEYFKWFKIDRNRRVHLVSDWDLDVTVFGVCFQFQWYKWYMYSR